jgi:hypothetical protein
VVTIAELNAGVLAAADVNTRALRMATLDALALMEVLPADGHQGLSDRPRRERWWASLHCLHPANQP